MGWKDFLQGDDVNGAHFIDVKGLGPVGSIINGILKVAGWLITAAAGFLLALVNRNK